MLGLDSVPLKANRANIQRGTPALKSNAQRENDMVDAKNEVELSIVIPAHNEEKFVQPTLDSLVGGASKLDLGWEIIVVDDDSTDRTAEIVKENGLVLEQVKLRNIGAVRNAGAKSARGKWLVFVDADTIVPESTLAMTVENLRNGVAGGGARVDLPNLDELSLVKRMMYHSVVTTWQRLGRWAAGCYMYTSKECFEQFGGFDERYFAAEELFFSRNVKKRGKFVIVAEPVITSSRKLENYSVWQLARFLTRPMFTTRGVFRTKKGLEILYEDKR